jgi:hypothetical protein
MLPGNSGKPTVDNVLLSITEDWSDGFPVSRRRLSNADFINPILDNVRIMLARKIFSGK